MNLETVELARELFAFVQHLESQKYLSTTKFTAKTAAKIVAGYIADRERKAIVATILSDLLDEGGPMVDDDPVGHGPQGWA